MCRMVIGNCIEWLYATIVFQGIWLRRKETMEKKVTRGETQRRNFCLFLTGDLSLLMLMVKESSERGGR